eukprot:97154-Amphidinium_carterae.1
MEESRVVREKCDRELKLYRQADAWKQQMQFGEVQSSLRRSHDEAVERNRITISERSQSEFRGELRAIHRELENFTDMTNDQSLRAELHQALDQRTRHEEKSFQLESRLAQVTQMSATPLLNGDKIWKYHIRELLILEETEPSCPEGWSPPLQH